MPAVAPPEMSAVVFHIMRFATHDGPGIRTSVFLKGCPLSCWWCHNPESQSTRPDRLYYEERCRHCLDCAAHCPQHAIEEVDGAIQTSDACTFCGECATVCVASARQIAGRKYELHELIAEVEKDVVFYDDSGGGVTLTGGEPLCQPAFSAAFLDACRCRGIRTAIETCGFAQPAVFRKVALAADAVLFDLKLIDREKHRRFTGVPNDLILANVEDLVGRHTPLVVRIPVVPGVNDTPQDQDDFRRYLSQLRPPRIELLPYHRIGTEKYRRLGRPYQLAETPSPALADLECFRELLLRDGLNVTLGG